MRTFIQKPHSPQKQQNKTHSPTSVPPIVREVLASSGQPLDAATRVMMEPRFGHDFSRVRVHADTKAAESADAVNARAYTVGQDIVLGEGRMSLASTGGGRHLLAHELAHVVQQSRGGQAPAVHPSAPHEHDAEEAATAIVAGQASVPVRQSTGIGLARQPKEKTPGTDIDLDQYLTLPKVSDPRSDSRYIDKLFQSVTYSAFNGASVFHWKENGKDQKIGVPLADLEQDDTRSFLPILDIHKSKAEALKVVQDYAASGTRFRIYTFYRTPDNIIMPTIFSIHSTPEFHKLWPGLKQGLAEKAAEIQEALVPLANAVNPIPGTQVDEHGNLSISSNPMDWMSLLRLRNIKRVAKLRNRYHSGYGVKYTVNGPHGKLKGTSVYILKDAQGEILYVGKGEALDRLREHIKDPNKTQWFGEIAEIEVRATGLNNTQALALEETLIGQLSPLHNKDMHPFHKEFGSQLAIGPNLPKSQSSLRFFLEWGH